MPTTSVIVYVYVCVCVPMYVCVCVSMYVCLCVLMYVCVCVFYVCLCMCSLYMYVHMANAGACSTDQPEGTYFPDLLPLDAPRTIIATPMRIGFLGLGMVGRGLVHNLLKSGHEVTVWNRTTSKVVHPAFHSACIHSY